MGIKLTETVYCHYERIKKDAFPGGRFGMHEREARKGTGRHEDR